MQLFQHLKEIPAWGWLGIVLFALVHPLAVAAGFVLIPASNNPLAIPVFVLGAIGLYLLLLVPKFRYWQRLSDKPVSIFLQTAFLAYAWYLPFGFFTLMIFTSVNAGPTGVAGVFGILLFPLFVVLAGIVIPISILTFRLLVGRHLRPAKGLTEGANPAAKRSYARGVAIVVAVIVAIPAAGFGISKIPAWWNPSTIKNLSEHQSTAPSGFLIPTEASIPQGFVFATSTYMTGRYIMAYTRPEDPPRITPTQLVFSEGARLGPLASYEREIAQADKFMDGPQSFTFNGSPGVVFWTRSIRPAGLISYKLFWNDKGNALSIELRLVGEQEFSAQDVINILSTMKRS